MKKRINNGVFYVVISLVALFAIGTVAMAFVGNAHRVIENVEVYNEATQPDTQVMNDNLGAMPSPDVYQHMNFHAGVQSGGSYFATSSVAATVTLQAFQFNLEKTFIDWTANLDTTLTTMATTSMDFMNIGNVGDERSYWFRSATTTAATTITFAAGTGVDIQFGDATGDDLVIDGLDLAKLTFIRKNDTDVLLLMTKYTEGD